MTTRALWVCLAVVVSSSAAAKERVVVQTLSSSDEDTARVAKQATEQLLVELTQREVAVLGESDIQGILGAERQRQLLGCSEGACMTEITNALGARHVVLGAVSRSGSSWRVDLKLLDTVAANVLVRAAVNFEREESVVNAMGRLANEVVAKLPGREPPMSGVQVASLVGAGAGAAMVGVGIGLMAGASGDITKLNDAKQTLYYDQALGRVRAAEGQATAGVVLTVAGGVVAAAGLVGALLTPRAKTSVGVALGPEGAGVVVGGVW
ncbi:MAG: hypothetical protein JNM17_28210 [Archangium sp.]|nr:hypothetical protein [Archangium sp.]